MKKKDILGYKEFYRRNLPHYQPEGGIFFLTYRLNIILPEELKQKIREIHIRFKKEAEFLSDKEREEKKINIYNRQFDLIDKYLGLCKKGPLWLKDDRIAQIVIDSLFYLNNAKYKLFTFCVMPNHVHILIKPLKDNNDEYYSFSKIMKSHKGVTANKANKILDRKGKFWHHENYDHFVRNEKGFRNIVWYILNNPVKAGLVKQYQDWPYNWVCEELKDDFNFE